mgnify:CR=1 FL=1
MSVVLSGKHKSHLQFSLPNKLNWMKQPHLLNIFRPYFQDFIDKYPDCHLYAFRDRFNPKDATGDNDRRRISVYTAGKRLGYGCQFGDCSKGTHYIYTRPLVITCNFKAHPQLFIDIMEVFNNKIPIDDSASLTETLDIIKKKHTEYSIGRLYKYDHRNTGDFQLRMELIIFAVFHRKMSLLYQETKDPYERNYIRFLVAINPYVNHYMRQVCHQGHRANVMGKQNCFGVYRNMEWMGLSTTTEVGGKFQEFHPPFYSFKEMGKMSDKSVKTMKGKLKDMDKVWALSNLEAYESQFKYMYDKDSSYHTENKDLHEQLDNQAELIATINECMDDRLQAKDDEIAQLKELIANYTQE